jgi:hypothetical protein
LERAFVITASKLAWIDSCSPYDEFGLKWPPKTIPSEFSFAGNHSSVHCKLSKDYKTTEGTSSKKRKVMSQQ